MTLAVDEQHTDYIVGRWLVSEARRPDGEGVGSD